MYWVKAGAGLQKEIVVMEENRSATALSGRTATGSNRGFNGTAAESSYRSDNATARGTLGKRKLIA